MMAPSGWLLIPGNQLCQHSFFNTKKGITGAQNFLYATTPIGNALSATG
jgi:hypothetical protein